MARKVHYPTTHFGKKIWKKKNASAGKAKISLFWQLRENYAEIFFGLLLFFHQNIWRLPQMFVNTVGNSFSLWRLVANLYGILE
jgi:hypothetical protein